MGLVTAVATTGVPLSRAEQQTRTRQRDPGHRLPGLVAVAMVLGFGMSVEPAD